MSSKQVHVLMAGPNHKLEDGTLSGYPVAFPVEVRESGECPQGWHTMSVDSYQQLKRVWQPQVTAIQEARSSARRNRAARTIDEATSIFLGRGYWDPILEDRISISPTAQATMRNLSGSDEEVLWPNRTDTAVHVLTLKAAEALALEALAYVSDVVKVSRAAKRELYAPHSDPGAVLSNFYERLERLDLEPADED